MTCYSPWTAYRDRNGGVSQKETADCESLSLPCGACIGCHMDRSMSWSLRCRHEAAMWTHNCFLTLTYDDEHLPWHGSLSTTEPRRFIRYLRRKMSGVEVAPDGSGKRPIRFFGCGEYGTRRARAHYHLLLFNVRFDDVAKYGSETYTSSLVSELWRKGTHLLGTLTPASASYVAGYALKKVSAWQRESKYGAVNYETGEFVQRVPEFAMMSLKPPIGYYWYEKYKSELRSGFVVVDGKEVAVPRLYRDKLAVDSPRLHEEMQWNRQKKMVSFNPADRSEARLAVRGAVASARKQFFSSSHMED